MKKIIKGKKLCVVGVVCGSSGVSIEKFQEFHTDINQALHLKNIFFFSLLDREIIDASLV